MALIALRLTLSGYDSMRLSCTLLSLLLERSSIRQRLIDFIFHVGLRLRELHRIFIVSLASRARQIHIFLI